VRRLAACVIAVLLPALSAAGCGSSGASERTTLTVLAAASLTDVSADLAGAYEREHPDVRLRFSLAGSQELASQVRQGAPADALVTADEPTMRGLGRRVRAAAVVATNRLTIVVGARNPEAVRSLTDLGRPDLVVVLAAPDVPAGRYARDVLDRAGVEVSARSEEPDVRAVLTRVRLGEADAGIVYTTDAASAGGDVETVTIADEDNVAARYPAAVVRTTEHPAEAAAFVEWLTSPTAARIFAAAGFGSP